MMDDAALGTCKRQSNFFSLIRILSIQDFSTCQHEARYQEDLPNSSTHQAGQQASTLLVEKRKNSYSIYHHHHHHIIRGKGT